MAGTVITADLPEIRDCRVLTRFKAFVTDQGAAPTLEHVMRERVHGNPIDLTDLLGGVSGSSESAPAVGARVSDSLSGSRSGSTSVSLPVSTPAPIGGVGELRIKEWLGWGAYTLRNPIWSFFANVTDPEKGVMQATIDRTVTEKAGIYELQWAVVDAEGTPIVVDRGLLSVERSLYPVQMTTLQENLGPPTLQEIRMMIMDSSHNENLILDDVEMKDEQILLSIGEPVRLWNETPPPIRQYTTRDFPFRGAWGQGIIARLYFIAASTYRRNRLKHSAGGITVDDMNLENEYMTEAKRLWDEYRIWLVNKKVECNMRLFSGQSLSEYSIRSGW